LTDVSQKLTACNTRATILDHQLSQHITLYTDFSKKYITRETPTIIVRVRAPKEEVVDSKKRKKKMEVTIKMSEEKKRRSPSIFYSSVVVIMLPMDPRFAGLNPTEDDGILRAIQIRSTTSFGGKVKPSVPYRKILRYVKEPCGV
jgi:hypothetical protein